MRDREFCDRTAVLAAEVARKWFAHLPRGATAYSSFGEGIVLFFGNDGGRGQAVVAKLREFFAIEEVGIRELGFGLSADRGFWALLVESRRDADYCRRLVGKAFHEAQPDGDG